MTPMSPPSKWPAPDAAPDTASNPVSPPVFSPPHLADTIPAGAAAGADGSPERTKSGWGRVVFAVGVVALVASTAGVFLGNRITDWMNEPPSRSSEEAINVAAPRDAIERRIDVAGVVDEEYASIGAEAAAIRAAAVHQ